MEEREGSLMGCLQIMPHETPPSSSDTGVSKRRDTSRLIAGIAAAERDVVMAGQQRFEEDGVFVGIAFEIDARDESEVALDVVDGRADDGYPCSGRGGEGGCGCSYVRRWKRCRPSSDHRQCPVRGHITGR